MDRQNDGGQRAGPTADHRIGNGFPHRRGRRDAVVFDAAHEALEVFDGDAAAGAAAWNAREVGGAEAEFRHAGFHPRGHVGHAARVGGDGEAAGDGGFDFLRGGVGFGALLLGLAAGLFVIGEPEALGFGGIDFDLPEDGADRVA